MMHLIFLILGVLGRDVEIYHEPLRKYKTRQISSQCKATGLKMQSVIDQEEKQGYNYMNHCITSFNSWSCLTVMTFKRNDAQHQKQQEDCVDQPILLL
jgi:hypothetical protein